MYQKTGYLAEQLRLFYISEHMDRTFPYHYHDFDKITIFFQGNVTYEIEGKAYSLKPFDIVLVRAGQIHRPIVRDTDVYERIIAYMSPGFFDTYRHLGCDLSTIFLNIPSQVLRQTKDIGNIYNVSCRLRQAWAEKKEDSRLLQQTIFLEFMIYLARAVKDQHVGYVKMGSRQKKIQSILEYINANLTKNLSISAIASNFFISPDYLMHLFKNETGYSIGNYITVKRLLLARRLIHDGVPLTMVCYDSGFKNYSTFYRAWKIIFHQSPRQGMDERIIDPEMID